MRAFKVNVMTAEEVSPIQRSDDSNYRWQIALRIQTTSVVVF